MSYTIRTTSTLDAPGSINSTTMSFISRITSTLDVLGSILFSSSAPSITPLDAATMAYLGQLEGIPGNQSLKTGLSNGDITGEDILKAAGLDVNPSDAHFIKSALLKNNERCITDSQAAFNSIFRQDEQ